MSHLTNTFVGIGVNPSITSITPVSVTSVRVNFSEAMSGTALFNASSSYTVSASGGSIPLTVISASSGGGNPSSIELTFNTEMTNGSSNYTLIATSGLTDVDGEPLSPLSSSFSGFGLAPYVDNVAIPNTLQANPTANISFSILDIGSAVSGNTVFIGVQQGTGSIQTAYVSGAFVAPFSGPSSSFSASGNGFNVVIDPTGSLVFDVVVYVEAQDTSFNMLSASIVSCDDVSSFPRKIIEVPEMETLVLHWNFENVTGSGNSSDGLPTTSDAKFIVEDISSGSLDLTGRYDWFGPIRYHQYPGQGDFYLPYDVDAVNTEYLPSAKQLPPEVLNSSNMVEIRTDDDDLFTRESRPIKHFYAIEKSPYAIITDEIIKIFGTIKDFNNLIGEPVNRYRQDYKALEKIRHLYFERVKNSTVDFEKFVDYFKWFDSSISLMLQQLIPASAHFSDEIRTLIESHVLERNKYWTKFPTLEFRGNIPEAGIRGINELLYNWKSGSAPVSGLQSENRLWWRDRAERTGSLSSGNPTVDESRTRIFSVRVNALNRSFNTPLHLGINSGLANFGVVQEVTASDSLDQPIRIENIKNSRSLFHISSSVRDAHVPLGNYTHDYEIVQTSGRTINNRWLFKSGGTSSISSSQFINGLSPYTLPERPATKHVFVERFSAPGGPDVMSRGKLDYLAEEFAINNNLNLRNRIVREPLNNYGKTHTEQFGYSSLSPTTPNYHKVNRNTSLRVEESGSAIITASVYDNQFIQRPIPQSEMQYSWIKKSGISGSSPIGYASEFWVPVGTSSIPGPDMVFVSGSHLLSIEQGGNRYFGYLPNEDLILSGTVQKQLYTDFAGINFHVYEPVTASANFLGYPQLVTGAEIFTNCLPVNYMNNYVLHCVAVNPGRPGLAGFINTLFLHRYGPYGYPTWKQIRTGEHPVAREHKKTNILSISDEPKQRILITRSGERTVYKDRRADTFSNYTEPSVVFRHRPMIHTLNVKGSNNPVSLRHTYTNNLAMFTNPEVNNRLGINKCDDQMYDRLKELYIDVDENEQENPVQGFLSLQYGEVIYPKEVNTGKRVIRSRVNYAETAQLSGTEVHDFDDSTTGDALDTIELLATASYDANGIDRSPIERRTFWRRDPKDRNRFGRHFPYPVSLADSEQLGNGSSVTPLINSQGIKDGDSTSLWPMGCELEHINPALIDSTSRPVIGTYENYDFGELTPLRACALAGFTGFNTGGNVEWPRRIDYLFYQNGQSPQYGSGSHYYLFSYPTASALYTKPAGIHFDIFSQYHSINGNVSGNYFPELQNGWDHRFRVHVHAGKDPWYDSYDEYAADIRPMAKDYSIIPEFNVSNNLPFFVERQGGNFRKLNDKFLTLPGADITQSATTETSGFDENFFKIFSHSDFLKYFDVVVNDHDNIDTSVSRISFTCKGIKKLLPYNGFYPVTRTVQLAQLFSQSYGPNIGGLNFAPGGKSLLPINIPSSGNLALTSLIQPFFAPGILYNSIKSGISVDWPVFTGSLPDTLNAVDLALGSSGRFADAPTYRIQFESLLDIKNGSGQGGVPVSSSDGTKKINFTGIEYMSRNTITESGDRRDVFFDWNGLTSSPLYSMAMHNFLAETVNFFISDGKIKSISSRPASKMKAMVSGNTYYMDVRLFRSNDVLMYGDKWNYTNKLIHSRSGAPIADYAGLTYTGKYFGSPFRWASSALTTYFAGIDADHIGTADVSHVRAVVYADPAYAPNLPPYQFGDSVARLAYKADGTEKNLTDPISYVLSKLTVQDMNDNLLDIMKFYETGSTDALKLEGVNNNSAWKGKMVVSSSVNMFGVAKGFKSSYDPTTLENVSGRAVPTSIEDSDPSFNSWVISPKMEFPIMNFRNQPDEKYKLIISDGASLGVAGPVFAGAAPVSGALFPIPKGMWSGYGEFCSGSTGIFLSVEESFPDLNPNEKRVTGSLIDIFGFSTDAARMGDIAQTKEISEAIVIIPFVDDPVKDTTYAKTVKVMGRNFFEIEKKQFESQKSRIETGKPAIPRNSDFGDVEVKETSISKLSEQMKQYVLPPEMNFLKYQDISPFVMYIFEFKHVLNRQDIADIWQGVMPRIAMTAEKDEVEIAHDMRPWEFFHGKKLPSNIRWMVFKIKKQAATNYFAKTADSKDDDRFRFDFKIGAKAPDYSFNWPYDYFSLVELAQIEAEVTVAPTQTDVPKPSPIPGVPNLPTPSARTIPIPTGTGIIGTQVSKKEIINSVTAKPIIKVNVFGNPQNTGRSITGGTSTNPRRGRFNF